MTARLRAFGLTLSLFVVATVLLLSGEAPLDSYLIEYADQCILKNNCPIIDWAPIWKKSLTDVPRQLKPADGGVGVVILPPNEIPIVDLRRHLAARKVTVQAPSSAAKR